LNSFHNEIFETFRLFEIERFEQECSRIKFAAAVINGDLNTPSCNAILNLKKGKKILNLSMPYFEKFSTLNGNQKL